MWRSSGLALVAALLPLASMATDLTFDVTGAVDYDTNVFRRDSRGTSRNIEDDVLFRLRPGVKIHEDRGQDFNYSARYQLPVELSTQFSELNDLDQYAEGELSYHPSSRSQIYAANQFRYLRSTLVNQQFSDASGVNRVDSGRDRVTLNDANLGARYLVGPRLNVGVEAGHRYFETSRRDRQDNIAASLTLNSFYTLSARHESGFGATYRFQDFQRSTQVVSSKAHSVNVFLQWRWQVDETTGLDVAVGPSLIKTQQDRIRANALNPTPPPPTIKVPLVSGKTETTIDVFAQVGFIKRWTPNLRTGARYTRSQGTASGLGGSVINDSVTATVEWDLTDRWDYSLRGDYSRRESVVDVTQFGAQSSKIKNNRWGARTRLGYRIARKTRVFGQVLYNNQNSSSELSDTSDFENWIFTLGFHHIFEPIKLW